MIQLVQHNVGTPYDNTMYLDIYKNMTSTTYKPLFKLTSQLSKKTIYTIALSADYANKERYVRLSLYTFTSSIPASGVIMLGTTDYPYGFYDVTVYQNTSNTNLDPDGLSVIWTGLANVKTGYGYSGSLPNPAVEYTEYVDNDSSNNSVYITAVPNN